MAEYYSKHSGAEIDAGIDAAKAALPKSGGTMTGPITLAGVPTENMHSANKAYVDTQTVDAKNAAATAQSTANAAKEAATSAKNVADNALPKSGGTMTGPIFLAQDPQTASEPASKKYTDEKFTGASNTAAAALNTATEALQATRSVVR